MSHILLITQKELGSYFATPVAYVFVFIFLLLSSIFTFWVGNLYERNQADLIPFFNVMPWLFLILVPAIGMKTWSEERKSGTVELLMTLPVNIYSAVLGKFLAAWLMIGLSLVMTSPIWLTVDYLGDPDQGMVVAGYTASWLMSAAFLSVSMCMSAATKSQVVAFILSVVICFFFVVSGSDIFLGAVSDWIDSQILDAIASFSFLTRFEAISRGVMSFSDLFYFISFSAIWLYASLVVIEYKKASR